MLFSEALSLVQVIDEMNRHGITFQAQVETVIDHSSLL